MFSVPLWIYVFIQYCYVSVRVASVVCAVCVYSYARSGKVQRG